jgi:thiamine transport system permease protein
MFGSQTLTTLPWLLYQQLGSYRLTEAAATALLLLTLCFSLFWLVERGLGGRHVDH